MRAGVLVAVVLALAPLSGVAAGAHRSAEPAQERWILYPPGARPTMPTLADEAHAIAVGKVTSETLTQHALRLISDIDGWTGPWQIGRAHV